MFARLLAFVSAAALIMLLLPLWLLRALWGLVRSGRVFDSHERIGRGGRVFRQRQFAGPGFGRRLALLWNILYGDMAWVGPRPLTPAEAETLQVNAEPRFSVRPGIFSPYRLRHKTGVAHADEFAVDGEYVRQKSLRGDLGILLRSLIAAVLSGGERPQPPTLQLFGVAIDNISMDEALDWMLARARSGPQVQAAFVNPDCLNIAYRHTDYRTVLQRADKVFPDGIGLQLACRMLGIGLRANVNGTDLFPLLCERLAGSDSGIFLLGAQPGMAAATAENMTSRYPGLRIVGVEHGYFSAAEQAQLIERINASGASILLVALGAPRQELWLAEQRDRLQANVLLGVGGLFDYYSGRIPRAPLWMREIGLEWVWRLLQEPARLWRRYIIGNPLFLYRVWKQGRRESKHE